MTINKERQMAEQRLQEQQLLQQHRLLQQQPLLQQQQRVLSMLVLLVESLLRMNDDATSKNAGNCGCADNSLTPAERALVFHSAGCLDFAAPLALDALLRGRTRRGHVLAER